MRKKLIKIAIIPLISLIIVLSGCAGLFPPRTDLQKIIIRNYKSTEQFNVISFIEDYDFLDFLPPKNNSLAFSNFERRAPHDSCVRNITFFLRNAEKHYKENYHFYEGDLYYYIMCSNTTTSNFSEALELAEEITGNTELVVHIFCDEELSHL